ncbi:carbohydrate esterase family 16 protein [Xylariaceae sp. FL1019]|nr:carbohydrate esterase family 16 protein [Xylariaceae sp. FL1019]
MGLRHLSYCIPLWATTVSTACVTRPHFNWDDTKYLLAFGDSYTYVQGTAGTQNFSFIGNYLPGDFSFTRDTLLNDKIVQNFTSTANGGPNWVEFLTGCGIDPGKTSPRDCDVQLWDFAFGGADVSVEFLAQHHNFTTPLVNQTQQYLKWAEPVIGRKMDKSKALVAIWIGINDMNDSSKFRNVSFPDFYDEIISAVFEQSVIPLFESGYKSFLFMNLPPLDRTQDNAASLTPLPNKEMIDWWDKSLAHHSHAFAAKHPSAKTMVYDVNTFLNYVMDNPDEFGIADTTHFCPDYANIDVLYHPEAYNCLPLDKYFWYNSGHMTSHTHKIMTSDLMRFLKKQSTTATGWEDDGSDSVNKH